ncbi:MAG: glycerophosphodiester phosphodiesterase [Planctomycetaceae bacterium]
MRVTTIPVGLSLLLVGTLMSDRGIAVEIVGHRGASYDAPENTLSSVKLAWKQNADAVEIDIYLTKDHQIVVIHDDSTKRVAGKEKLVVRQTLDELKSLDAGLWKNEKYKDERIPTLAEVLDTIPDGKRLFIEVKCGPEVAPELARVLKSSGKRPGQTAVIGFSLETVEVIKKAMPELQVYWIVQLKHNKKTGQWLPHRGAMIRCAQRAGLDGVDIGKLESVDKEYIDAFKKAGLQFYCWTINDPAEARRLAKIRVDGITTDRPGWLREQLSPSSP